MKVPKIRFNKIEKIMNWFFNSEVDIFITIGDVPAFIIVSIISLLTFYLTYILCIWFGTNASNIDVLFLYNMNS